jgi:hypothetical protein
VLFCTSAGIKAIKLYAWESPYLDRINALRETELRAIRKTQLLSMVRILLVYLHNLKRGVLVQPQTRCVDCESIA